MTGEKHAVIIGGGFGGIAAALRVRKLGYAVTLIDKLDALGGKAQVIHHRGYTHDTGPTVITAPWLFDELFTLFGKRRSDYITFIPLPLWYRYVYPDGDHFDYMQDYDATMAEINRISPTDTSGYTSLLAMSKSIYHVGFDQLACKPFHRLWDMLRLIPTMLRLRSFTTVWQLVCSYITHPKLRQAFSIQPLLVGGNPLATTSIYSLIHYLERKGGIHFAKGGTGALVKALHTLLEEEGVTVLLNTKVDRIHTKQQSVVGVTYNDNTYLPADVVIANTDPYYLYGRMLDTKLTFNVRLKQRRSYPSMGLFVLFFGTTRRYDDIAHHTISMGPRYEGLLKDIFSRQVLADDFSYYLHRPCATDNSFAPSGCDSFYALVPVPNNQSTISWDIEGPTLQQKVLDHLESTFMPELHKHLDHVFFHSPDYFTDSYLNPHGAAFSMAPLFFQSAWFRFHNQAEGVKDLYLVGAGTHPGAGIPGVLCSAKVVTKLLEAS